MRLRNGVIGWSVLLCLAGTFLRAGDPSTPSTPKTRARNVRTERSAGEKSLLNDTGTSSNSKIARTAYTTSAKGDTSSADPLRSELPPLPPRQEKSAASRNSLDRTRASSSGWGTALLGLIVVLTLILSFAYAFRKHIPLTAKILPADIVEVLGRRYIDPRNSVQLIRIGSRILIVAHSPQHGMQTLSEITDPIQVDELAGRCLQSTTSSSSTRFSQMLSGQLQEPLSPELPEEEDRSDKSRKANRPLWGRGNSSTGRSHA